MFKNNLFKYLGIGFFIFLFTSIFSVAYAATIVNIQISQGADDAHDDPAPFWPGYSATQTSIYAGHPGSTGAAVGGYRFVGLSIPENSTIINAYAEFNQSGWGYIIPTTLSFEDIENPTTFTSTYSPLDRWAFKTTFEAPWTWTRLSPGTWHKSPSLTGGLQELVDTYGGIDTVVLLEKGNDLTPNGQHHAWSSFEASPLSSAKLFVEYESGVDSVPPIRSNGQPTGELSAGTIQTTISLTTSENATCKYGQTPNIEYALLNNTFATTGGVSHSETVSGLENGTSYTFYVKCQDVSNNVNSDDFTISFSVAVPDLIPPVLSNGSPSGDLPSGTTQTTLSVSSNESATCKYDSIPGVSYSLMSNTFTTTGSTSHSTVVNGLSDDSSYEFYIKCQDDLGNENVEDFLINFNILPDTIPPIISNGQPTGALPAGTNSVSLSVETNENAECRYNTSLTTWFTMIPFEVTNGLTHSALITGLTNDTDYTYHVKCEDSLQNLTEDDFQINFSINPEGPIIIDTRVSSSSDDAHHDPDGWPSYSHADSSIFAGKPGGSGGQATWGGFRWTGFDIPSDAVIQTAFVEFTQSGWGYTIPTILTLEDSPNPSTFNSNNSPYNRGGNTTEFNLQWTWPRQTPGAIIKSPSLTEGIQELVSKHGNITSIVLLENGAPATSGQSHNWSSFDAGSSVAPRLYIEYTTGPAADTVAPFRTNGLPVEDLPFGTEEATISLDTHENATCKYATSPDVTYGLMTGIFSNTGSTSHSTLVNGLIGGADYSYYVRCQDENENTNDTDFVIEFRVLSEEETNTQAGVPWKLVFDTQPATISAGGILPSITVSVRDIFGGVASSSSVPITIKLANNSEGAVISGTTTVTSNNGLAVFSDLSVDEAGNYTFVASAPLELLGHWDGGGRYSTVAAEGNYAFIAHLYQNSGVDVIDISDPSNPTKIADWGNGSVAPHEGGQVINNIGYFGSDDVTGASIVDFSNPQFPQLRSRITAAEGGSNIVHNTFSDGNYLYIIDNLGPNIPVFDVSDPDNPVKVATITTPTGAQVHDVTVDHGKLYLFEITGSGTSVFDVSQGPQNATYLGFVGSGASSHSGQFSPDGKYMIVNRETLTPGGDARIFDVTNPNNAQHLATINPVALGFGDVWPHESFAIDNMLYFAWRSAGFQMFEFSDPSDPVLIGSHDMSLLPEPATGAFEVYPISHNRVLISDSENGLYIFDTTPIGARSGSFIVQ